MSKLFSEVGCRWSEPAELAWDPDRSAGDRGCTGPDCDVSGAADSAG